MQNVNKLVQVASTKSIANRYRINTRTRNAVNAIDGINTMKYILDTYHYGAVTRRGSFVINWTQSWFVWNLEISHFTCCFQVKIPRPSPSQMTAHSSPPPDCTYAISSKGSAGKKNGTKKERTFSSPHWYATRHSRPALLTYFSPPLSPFFALFIWDKHREQFCPRVVLRARVVPSHYCLIILSSSPMLRTSILHTV